MKNYFLFLTFILGLLSCKGQPWQEKLPQGEIKLEPGTFLWERAKTTTIVKPTKVNKEKIEAWLKSKPWILKEIYCVYPGDTCGIEQLSQEDGYASIVYLFRNDTLYKFGMAPIPPFTWHKRTSKITYNDCMFFLWNAEVGFTGNDTYYVHAINDEYMYCFSNVFRKGHNRNAIYGYYIFQHTDTPPDSLFKRVEDAPKEIERQKRIIEKQREEERRLKRLREKEQNQSVRVVRKK